MTQSPFSRRSKQSWTPREWETGPSNDSAEQYDSTIPARTPIPSRTASTTEKQETSPSTTSNVIHHRDPWNTRFATSPFSQLQDVPDSSKSSSRSLQALESTATTAEKAWMSLWIFTDAGPPPHTRSLYATIPLPSEDSPSYLEQIPTHGAVWKAAEWSSTLAPPDRPCNPNPLQIPFKSKQHASTHLHPRPIQLHPTLQGICLASRQIQQDAQRLSSSPSTSMDWVRDRDAPATYPSVGCLTLVIHSTGQTVCVRPTTPASLHVVTVSDVLDTLKDAFMIDDVCRGRRQSGRSHSPICECERMSVKLNSLQLWWGTSDGVEVGPHPWQLVVAPK
ncbi:hypothetical protein D9615_006863 [Tricholomella constricta]|uniref:Uncharacterized protein n=1 Tax=Tricholomella constricta TaxID=117010 RepID=A0A8H5M2X6_9AGAR|nr:hypothetical protein D9615_006863 [Tricholomella constricta]